MRPKIFCLHGNMVLVKLQVEYHMSILGLPYPQARGPIGDAGGTYFEPKTLFTHPPLIFKIQMSSYKPKIKGSFNAHDICVKRTSLCLFLPIYCFTLSIASISKYK